MKTEFDNKSKHIDNQLEENSNTALTLNQSKQHTRSDQDRPECFMWDTQDYIQPATEL